MPLIDVQVIIKKVKLINIDLQHLKKFKNISYKEYLKDDIRMAAIERILERITGRIIGINYHILKEEYELIPEDYYNSFVEIGKNKVVSTKLANEMANSAGLRNALAHEYEKIDNKMVYYSIKIALKKVPQYLKDILDFIS